MRQGVFSGCCTSIFSAYDLTILVISSSVALPKNTKEHEEMIKLESSVVSGGHDVPPVSINPEMNDGPPLRRNDGDTDNESDGLDDNDLVEKISEHNLEDNDFE
ncbi:hypothetical protein Fot_21957 [Forsythia ovata]|uniref:Uncharacterized protein n=1 Tax=Forsythia ovata TaxID=205694 RepID=A0ABD1UWP8_9LAMI